MILSGSPLLCAVGSAPVALQNKPVGQHTVRQQVGAGRGRGLVSHLRGRRRPPALENGLAVRTDLLWVVCGGWKSEDKDWTGSCSGSAVIQKFQNHHKPDSPLADPEELLLRVLPLKTQIITVVTTFMSSYNKENKNHV